MVFIPLVQFVKCTLHNWAVYLCLRIDRHERSVHGARGRRPFPVPMALRLRPRASAIKCYVGRGAGTLPSRDHASRPCWCTPTRFPIYLSAVELAETVELKHKQVSVGLSGTDPKGPYCCTMVMPCMLLYCFLFVFVLLSPSHMR